MAKCIKCGKRGLFLVLSGPGLCPKCMAAQREEAARRIEEAEAARKRAEEERAERIRLAAEEYQRRLEQKKRDYERMIADIKACEIAISAEPAPIILAKNQTPVTYSSITKKTPRDKLGNFVAVDTETTGLRPASCEIIDIAAIRFRDYIPVEKFSMLLSAKKPIPPESIAIHGITDEMVAGQPRFQQIAESFLDFIGNDNLVGHNLPFDLSFIMRYGADVTQTKRKYYDTLEIAKKTVKQMRRKWDKEFEEYVFDYESYGIENYKLGTLCDWYGILNPESHRAEGDALAAGLLLKKLADNRE